MKWPIREFFCWGGGGGWGRGMGGGEWRRGKGEGIWGWEHDSASIKIIFQISRKLEAWET